MKIEKAIGILARDVIPNYPYAVGEKARAIQLGIEALKRHQKKASLTFAGMMGPLPGETSPEKEKP